MQYEYEITVISYFEKSKTSMSESTVLAPEAGYSNHEASTYSCRLPYFSTHTDKGFTKDSARNQSGSRLVIENGDMGQLCSRIEARKIRKICKCHSCMVCYRSLRQRKCLDNAAMTRRLCIIVKKTLHEEPSEWKGKIAQIDQLLNL